MKYNPLLDEEILALSYSYALQSNDPSTQNGAVLLSSKMKIIGTGCNNFPVGVDEKFWHGDKEAKYARVVHAEMAAILDAARQGYSTKDSILFCGWAACSNCAKHIAASGISKLIRHTFSNSGVTTGSHWYDDCKIGDEIMLNAGIKIVEVDPVKTNIKLRRNGEMWPATV